MLAPSRFYRKYKCIVDHYDDATGKVVSVRRTLDLGDISEFEEYLGEKFRDNHKRIIAYFYVNKPPIYIRISYDEFDALFEKYHGESGTLDNRSVKKKLNYRGPIKMWFSGDNRFVVANAFPVNYDFKDKTPEMINDDMIYYNITGLN